MSGVKIIATVGPACDSPGVIEAMARAGISSLRINTAHIEAGYIGKICEIARGVNRKLGMHISVMVDLKGPELRTGDFPGGTMKFSEGELYRLGGNGGDSVAINSPDVLETLSEGDSIVMGDGAVRFEVEAGERESVLVKALNSGTLRDRSRVNVPGKLLSLGTLTERDRTFVAEAASEGADFFALSFVQQKEDVFRLNELLLETGSSAEIVSKIETQNGLNGIRSISSVSDWVMVARGDLGVEIPLHEVAMAQKEIIREAHRFGVPTVVATQMLESMISTASPTRAEVSDVTNAILDNADAVMLSGETAIGKHPVESVRYMREICDYVESSGEHLPEPSEFLGNRIAFSIARASRDMAEEIHAGAILAFTKSGSTARMLSAVRPGHRIYAAVTDAGLARRLSLLKGVDPVIIPGELSESRTLNEAMDFLNSSGIFRLGQRIVVTSGSPYFLFGGTNDIRVITSGSFLGRGYPAGPSLKGRVTMNTPGDGDIVLLTSLKDVKAVSGFSGIILQGRVNAGTADALRDSGKTVLFSARFIQLPGEGDEIYIDAETGVVLGSGKPGDQNRSSRTD